MTGFTVTNRTVEFDIAPTADVLVTLYRVTPTEPLVGWADASVIKALDMTVAQVQQLHIIEENRDWSRTNSVVLENNVYNMRFHRMINVADPQDPQDAVTKNYMETVQGGFVQQNQALVQQATQQANIATTKAGEASVSASAAKTSETNAQKWAESPDSPDSSPDSESPTGETMSAKEWALYAEQLALKIGNPVADVSLSEGTVSIEKLDGSINTFDVVTKVNDITVERGNVYINRKFYNSLEQLGLQYATVTFDTIVNAMPANSTLTFYVDVLSSQPTYAPNLSVPISGLVIVNKGGDNSVPIEFTICSIVKAYTTYTGKYTTYNSYGFSGWIPVINKVQGLPADINGNATLYKYQEWKYSGADATIDGFMITFADGYSTLVWYFDFKNNKQNITVNFPKAFITPPVVTGCGVVVSGSKATITCNAAQVTKTNCQLTHDTTGSVVTTYWTAFGYSTF